MNRSQLEHIIRAGNTDADDIVVIGSQAILGAYPDAPGEPGYRVQLRVVRDPRVDARE